MVFALTLRLLASLQLLQVAAQTYTNPISKESQVDLGDPGALFLDGFYYLATSSGDAADAFPIRRSADLATWTVVGHVFPDWKGSTNPTWAKGDFWAPDLQVVNDRVACYFSARAPGGILGGGILSLGVAFADNITGPFVDSGKTLWEDKSNTFGTIDVHMHETSEGEKYLVWKKNQNVAHLQISAHLMMQLLTDDGAALSDDPAFTIATADQKWEEYGCVEAPWILERNGTFYLFYSGSMVNFNSYAVGVARSDTVTGPYIKKPEPVIHGCDYSPPKAEARFLQESAAHPESDIVYTPGHCSVLPVHGEEDRWVMFYHGRDNNGDKDHRVLMMDELTWGKDGWPHVVGDCPSSTSVPVPTFSWGQSPVGV